MVLDVFECKDLIDAHDEGRAAFIEHSTDYAFEPRAWRHSPRVQMRRHRMRDGLLLAMYLDDRGATTLSFQNEVVDVLTRRVPPAPVGGTDVALARMHDRWRASSIRMPLPATSAMSATYRGQHTTALP